MNTLLLLLRPTVLTGALLLGAAGFASAQGLPIEFSQRQPPGWSFTPGLSVAGLFDSNVALSSPRADLGVTQGDRVFTMTPSGRVSFLSKHTTFSGEYSSSIRRYMEFEGLNGYNQHASVSLRRTASRRLTLSLSDNYSAVESTDEVEVNGVPFSRIGTSLNTFAAGLGARLTKFTSLTAGYENVHVSFDRPDEFVTGGRINGLHGELSRQMNERTGLGIAYSVRRADIDEGLREFTTQEAGFTLAYQLAAHTRANGGAGLAYLIDHTAEETRTGPHARVGITHDAPRARVGVNFSTSFVPSFGGGLPSRSQQMGAFINVPIKKYRAYVQGSGGWRRTDPLSVRGLQLDVYRTRTVVGHAPTPWLRVEGFYDFSRHDSEVTGGEIHRHRAGGQLVISQTMRFR